MVKLLVSIKEPGEILDAVDGGADIIDVKNTERGSLGLPSLGVAREVALKIGKLKEKSAPLGDVDHYDEYLAYTPTCLASWIMIM
ncbi:(5-formylfuran-3-yl)methyl phosphate synthase [Vulcanisaeta sp. JCM 14467]|uniref:(5-formylfuran-3-yl)methyl phosphate synthase n=1 Tax=Vulcanisaeta sp. JCM 14467 TaxID=1295370 RepID=UPI0006D0AFD4|nr:(5-formylfuran-3-yl)methyl phosphate synthase [Vulcanisaeta sp. JCM 14467]